MGSDKLKVLKDAIKSYPDFPKKGIIFRDIFSVLSSGETLKILFDLLLEHARSIRGPIDAVIGLESRGFLLGPHIAFNMNVPFVPIRKKGKLPGELARTEYELEYGSDVVEVQKTSLKPGSSVLIVDDLLATGGTLSGACKLMKELNVTVTECFVVMELSELKGRDKVQPPVYSLVNF